tara:strand:- start:1595 stop:1714 length:120 start_codon:yes stop_codon:yes gene_type:complete
MNKYNPTAITTAAIMRLRTNVFENRKRKKFFMAAIRKQR